MSSSTKKSPWVTVAIVLVGAGLLWRHGGALKARFLPPSDEGKESSRPCTDLASETLLVWENGARGFVNPPFDTSAWSVLEGNMRRRIRTTRKACGGDLESSRKSRELLDELDSLVTSIDAAISSGVPFSNETSRQLGRLEELSEDAKGLARQGK
jgi:hypothetical protein